uniref:AIG1-type G domain-containing protein n=1 Tax=Astyanax mexicanus TaxID=7994 RepID=A0A3B1II04_ASTMX
DCTLASNKVGRGRRSSFPFPMYISPFVSSLPFGKSAAGNTILRDNVFKTQCSPDSETHKCKRAEKVINGRRIVVIDTPGIFDTDRPEEDLKKEILSSLVECAPGPHVFILVMEVGRYTNENQQAVQRLLELFTGKVPQHTVLLFTNGDKLKFMTINEFINKSGPTDNKSTKQTLKDLAERCGNRVHVIDNEYWNKNIETTQEMASTPAAKIPWFRELADQFYMAKAECQHESEVVRRGEYHSNSYQLTQLIRTIRNILEENKGQHYSNETLEEIGEAINEEVENINHETEHEMETVDTVEIRREARERVRTKLGEKLVGVTVGTLLGCLLGVGVGVAAPFVLAVGGIKKVLSMATLAWGCGFTVGSLVCSPQFCMGLLSKCKLKLLLALNVKNTVYSLFLLK